MRQHVKDMLEMRGDDVSYIDEHGDAVEPKRYYNEIITLDTNNTVVFFALNKAKELKEREKNAEDMMNKYDKRKHFIAIFSQPPSSPILTKYQLLQKELLKIGGTFGIFYTKELMYNPLKHELVPQHRKMTETEANAIMDEYKIRHHKHMPIISKDDVVARWLGLCPGNVVEITRYNETSGTYYYYRCCM